MKLRDSTGGAYESRGRFFMRITVAPQKRPAKLLPWCASLDDAKERTHVTQALVNRLRQVEQVDFVGKLVETAANADAAKMADLDRFVAGVEGGAFEKKRDALPSPAYATLRTVLQRWVSGELARDFPDYVTRKRSVRNDRSLQKHVPDAVLDLPLTSWTVATYESVMAKVPRTLSSARRRQIAQLMHRAFELAVYPLKLVTASPIPRLPKFRREHLIATLRPEHTSTIAKTGAIDLGYRFLWNYLAETGWRLSQATGREELPDKDSGDDNGVPALKWRDLVLARQVAFLSRTKTTAAVEIPLDDETVAGLRAWRSVSPKRGDDDPIFVTTDGAPIPYDKAARVFREHLNAAGFTRATDRDLFPEGDEATTRLAVRVHDLRGLFVTASLAQGRTDTWVRERTLHKTPSMLDTYRAKVAHFRKLGPIVPAVEAIPELAAANAAAERGGRTTTEGATHRRKPLNKASGPLAESAYAADLKIELPQGTADDRRDSSQEMTVDTGAPEGAPPRLAAASDPVEEALAKALTEASAASEWPTVALLAKELEARRLARASSNVVAIDLRRRERRR